MDAFALSWRQRFIQNLDSWGDVFSVRINNFLLCIKVGCAKEIDDAIPYFVMNIGKARARNISTCGNIVSILINWDRIQMSNITTALKVGAGKSQEIVQNLWEEAVWNAAKLIWTGKKKLPTEVIVLSVRQSFLVGLGQSRYMLQL